MAYLSMTEVSKKDRHKRRGWNSGSQTSSSHRTAKPRNNSVSVFDRLFSSSSSGSKRRSRSGSDLLNDVNTANNDAITVGSSRADPNWNPGNDSNLEIDHWYERAGEGGDRYNAINPNLSLRHPYGGANYARFETPLRLISHNMEVKTQNQSPSIHRRPFRFLDLPKEIRLLVYECLTIRTRHDLITKVYEYNLNRTLYQGQISCTMVTKCVPGISILATCKKISEEAWPILIPLLNYVNYQPLSIVLGVRHAAETIASPASPLAAIIGYYAALRAQPAISYTEFLDEAQQSFNPKPPASDVHLLNNGYYQDYPFHLYPWVFRDPVFRNSVNKASRQLVAHNPRIHSVFSATCEIQIGLTNYTGMSSDLVTGCTDLLHSALQRWFSSTRVVVVVRPVPHTCSTSQFTNVMSDIWQRAGRSNFAKVVRGRPVSIEEWESSWAEGEKFLD